MNNWKIVCDKVSMTMDLSEMFAKCLTLCEFKR